MATHDHLSSTEGAELIRRWDRVYWPEFAEHHPSIETANGLNPKLYLARLNIGQSSYSAVISLADMRTPIIKIPLYKTPEIIAFYKIDQYLAQDNQASFNVSSQVLDVEREGRRIEDVFGFPPTYGGFSFQAQLMTDGRKNLVYAYMQIAGSGRISGISKLEPGNGPEHAFNLAQRLKFTTGIDMTPLSPETCIEKAINDFNPVIEIESSLAKRLEITEELGTVRLATLSQKLYQLIRTQGSPLESKASRRAQIIAGISARRFIEQFAEDDFYKACDCINYAIYQTSLTEN